LKWLIKAFQTTNNKSKFFNPFSPNLQELKITTANRSRISKVKSEKAGRKELEAFKEMRKYLIY
jgi:hypothetical protein